MAHKKKQTAPRSNMQEIVPGSLVQVQDAYLGQVEQVFIDQGTQKIVSILVRLEGQVEPLSIPGDLIDKTSFTNDKVLLNITRAQLLSQVNQQNVSGTGSELRVPLVEERLTVDKQLVELGEVLLHKTVEQLEEVTNLPLAHEELEIVREPVNNEVLDKPLENRYEGEWLVIPVMKEVVVVKKQLVLVENIRIRKHQVMEEQEIREQVRRERITVEDNSKGTRTHNLQTNT